MGIATKQMLSNLSFLNLTDTPKSYSGAALEFVQVNSGQTGLVFTVAVVPTGSPVSGNLTKFSGASSITNGDLSGVVTTSGTLVTTAANPFQIGAPYVRTGSGAGPGTDPEGSIYLRTDNGLLYSQFLTSGANPARVQDKCTNVSYTGTLTSTPTPGNYVIAIAYGLSSPSVSAGWTSRHTGNDTVSPIGTLYRIVAYRLVQAGDSTSYTPFTGSNPQSVSLFEVSGLDQANFSNSLAFVGGNTGALFGSATLSFTTTSNNNYAILGGQSVSSGASYTTVLGGSTTWTHQSSVSETTIGSASIASSSTVVNGTASPSGGTGNAYTAECMVVFNPPPASQDTGLQQVSYLTVLKNAGSNITTNPRSVNFSTGLSASDDGEGNTTVTATGAVTSVTGSGGVTASPTTGAVVVSLSAIADDRVLANTSGGSAAPVATSPSALLDYAFSNTRGSVLYRGASGWAALGPGTSGYSLITQGAGNDPTWSNVAGGGGGGVTSITFDATWMTGGTITVSGTDNMSDAAVDALAMANHRFYGGI